MNVDKLKINFGTRVEELLNERQIAPRTFYDAIGINPQAYYDWKKKDQVPYATTALKVARFFGVTVEYLIEGTTDNPLQQRVIELQKKNLELANQLRSVAEELTKA